MPDVRRRSFVSRYLDPASHMGEILFGLIMTLTFTLAAGIVIQEEGREGAREMLIGILGCNLAWGIIDGVLYVLGQVFERGRLRRIGVHVRQAVSETDARQAIADEFDDALVPVADEPARQQLYSAILERVRGTPPAPNRVRREDVLGGLAAGWLVFACSSRSCSGCCSSSAGASRATRWPGPGSREPRSCWSDSCWSRWRSRSAADQRSCRRYSLGVIPVQRLNAVAKLAALE